jgi:hypothetical protein
MARPDVLRLTGLGAAAFDDGLAAASDLVPVDAAGVPALVRAPLDRGGLRAGHL